MKTTYVAAKDLQIEDKRAKKGDVLFTIETDYPLERMFAAPGNGSAVAAEELADRVVKEADAEIKALAPALQRMAELQQIKKRADASTGGGDARPATPTK